jgi:hypothetical protein
MAIKLTDVAIYFKSLEHQVDALNYLQANIPANVLTIFEQKWRTPETKPAPKPVVTQDNSWDGVYQMAKKAGAKFPEVVAAQWALESGWGEHTSGKNNFFGLKGSGTNVNTQEFINGKWITIKAGFLDFPDVETCVQYLVDRWYKDFGKFKGVNRASNRNECAQLLVNEGYATDSGYATKLMQIMDQKIGTIPASAKPNLVPEANSFLPSSPFSYKITPNITYGEICLSQDARRFTHININAIQQLKFADLLSRSVNTLATSLLLSPVVIVLLRLINLLAGHQHRSIYTTPQTLVQLIFISKERTYMKSKNTAIKTGNIRLATVHQKDLRI